MMRTKRIIILVLSVLCLTSFAIGIAGCNGNENSLRPELEPGYITPTEPRYEYVYSSQFDGPNNPDILIDGKLDEAVWQNKKWYTSKFYTDIYDTMPMLTVTAFNTEYGTYMGVKVRDNNIIYNGMLYLDKNSLIEFYFYADKTDTVADDRDYSLRRAFMMDYAGELYSTGERMKRAITVDGEINSGNTVGATFEIFIPWSEFGIDVSDGIYPQKLYLLPTYRPILKGNSGHTPLFNVPFNMMNHISDYYVFDEDGYINEDTEGAIIGDAYNGTAKSACWDLENLDDGIISITSGVEFNSIFFKDAFCDNFKAETTIYPFGGSSEYEGWYAGFLILSTNGNYYTMMLDMRNAKLTAAADGGKALKQYSLVTLTEAHGGNWEQINKINKDNPAAQGGKIPEESGVKFKIIKDKNTIYYFVDGEYLYSETLDFVQGNVYAGLFNMNVYADYKDFSFKSLSDAEVAEELESEKIYLVDVAVNTEGGSAKVDNNYVLKGSSAEIEFVSESGYKLSSVSYNGEDITEAVKENAIGGFYTINNISENICLEVSFEQIQNPLTYKGFLKIGDENVEDNIFIISRTNAAVRYDVSSSEENEFEVQLEAGIYDIFADNHFGVVSIDITEDLQQDLQLGDYVALDAKDNHNLNIDFIKQRANSVKGNVTEWFLLKESATTAYMSANIYNYDLDGFTVETDDGDNVQFYLAYQGLYVFKNHDWITISGVNYTKYSYFGEANKGKVLNSALMIDNGVGLNGEKVEIAISDGVLYLAVGESGKIKLELVEFNANFTAETNYRLGFCTYNANNVNYPSGGAVYENIYAAFGDNATENVNAVKAMCAYEDFDLGEELYAKAFMSKVGGTIKYSAEAAGADIIDGVEIEQGKSFMIYATIKKSDINGVGFVVGTLGSDNSSHLLFNWRQWSKDIYVSRETESGKWGWKGIADGTYPCSYSMGDEMHLALAYKIGKYLFFVNGELVASIVEDEDIGWGVVPQNVIGTTGVKKIGLSALYGSVDIIDYGYSTDEDEINAFVGAIPLYKGMAAIKDNVIETTASGVVGAFLVDGAEVAVGENYMVSVKLDSVNAENVGFVVGTLGDDNKSHVMFDWRYKTDVNDIYIWRESPYGWAGIDDNTYPCTIERGDGEHTLTLVCKNNNYYMFIDGTEVFNKSETENVGWGTVIGNLVGSGETIKVGITTSYGTAQFSDFALTTDADAINEFVPNEATEESEYTPWIK